MEEKGLVLPEMNDEGQYIVQIKEEYIKTGGHFQSQSFELEIPAIIGIYDKVITFPIGVGILNSYAFILDSMIQDEVQCIAGENTVVGAIELPVNIDDSIIKISSNLIQYCDIGFYVNLYDGINSENLGRIISKDIENETITTEFKSTKNFSVDTPTYLRLSIYLVNRIKFFNSFKLDLGYKKTGANYINAGKTFTIRYNNVNGQAKIFSMILEYLY
jgi:hypothetical protein